MFSWGWPPPALAIAAIGTAHSTVEELFLMQKAIRGFGIENVDFRLRQTDFDLFGKVFPHLVKTISEL